MSETNEKEEALKKYVRGVMVSSFHHCCPMCARIIILTSGCNLVHCRCGHYFCYYCGKLLPESNSYSHFLTAHCPLMISDIQRSKIENDKDKALEAGREAERKWREMHPEFKGEKLDLERLLIGDD